MDRCKRRIERPIDEHDKGGKKTSPLESGTELGHFDAAYVDQYLAIERSKSHFSSVRNSRSSRTSDSCADFLAHRVKGGHRITVPQDLQKQFGKSSSKKKRAPRLADDSTDQMRHFEFSRTPQINTVPVATTFAR
jgi:hypothetical protein